MPIREYVCQACAHHFEVGAMFADPHPVACPECGGNVRQVYHTFVLKIRRRGWKPPTVEDAAGPESVESALLPADWNKMPTGE